MTNRLSNNQIGDFIIACLRNRVEGFIGRMGGEIELPFRFLLECNPLTNLVSQGILHLTVDNRLLSSWDDFVQLTADTTDEFLVTISLVEN